jgi:hypothetical protein
VRIIVPEAPIPAAAAPGAHRAREGAGLRLGLLDNSKSNADHLLDFLVEGIKSAMPIASIVRLRKPHASLPAEAHQIDRLAKGADLVVSAMAD